jgi:hypothetical protein
MVGGLVILIVIGGLALAGLAAVILGIVALVRINRSGGALRGRGLAIAAIVIGGLMLIAPCLSAPAFLWADRERHVSRSENTRLRGAQAALVLAEAGRPEVEKFLGRDQTKPWVVTSLAGRPELAATGLQIEDAVVYGGPANAVIASMKPQPSRVIREQEPLSELELGKVRCQRGAFLGSGGKVACWLFTVPVEVPGQPEFKASAVLIVGER